MNTQSSMNTQPAGMNQPGMMNTQPGMSTTAMPLNTGAVPYTSTPGAPSTIVTPTGTTFANGDTAAPSALKGNITSMMGKMQHNPDKQHAGNAMVASSKEAKAARFEAKAIEWERKGNVTKAQKNRGKAALLRQKAIAKLNQPTVMAYPPGVKNDKAARCELKALEYEKKGNLAKAQRNREKAYRIREKHGIAHPVGTMPPANYSSTNATTTPMTTQTVPPTH
eukprot:Phypoly_transcript_17598.p1 GENE.Phypoly_transcript_17598~~Phypoly_transcript_17598.p1  ORF type:complete len:223 (+),score=61.80 Phypoly_transcript_17598:78-746(+)